MARRGKKGLIGRWYLLSGMMLLVFGVGNVLFNRSVRESLSMVGIELSPEPVDVGRWFSGHDGAGGSKADVLIAPVSQEQLKAFADSFTERDVGKFRLPDAVIVVMTNSNSVANSSLRDAEDVAAGFLPWPVRVKGFRDTDDGRLAYIGRDLCGAGRLVRSVREGRCSYRVVAVKRRCVWFQAVPSMGDDGGVSLPGEMEWPDVLRVELASGAAPGVTVPYCVVLADGSRLGKDDVCAVVGGEGVRVRYQVREIWRGGVCFDILAEGDGPGGCRLTCMFEGK